MVNMLMNYMPLSPKQEEGKNIYQSITTKRKKKITDTDL